MSAVLGLLGKVSGRTWAIAIAVLVAVIAIIGAVVWFMEAAEAKGRLKVAATLLEASQKRTADMLKRSKEARERHRLELARREANHKRALERDRATRNAAAAGAHAVRERFVRIFATPPPA